jgi:hypothetical protein
MHGRQKSKCKECGGSSTREQLTPSNYTPLQPSPPFSWDNPFRHYDPDYNKGVNVVVFGNRDDIDNTWSDIAGQGAVVGGPPPSSIQQPQRRQGNADELVDGDIYYFDRYVAKMKQDPENFPDIFNPDNAMQVAQQIALLYFDSTEEQSSVKTRENFINYILEKIPDYCDYVEKQEKVSSFFSGGSKTRKSKKLYGNIKTSFRKRKVVTRKKTKRSSKKSSKKSFKKSSKRSSRKLQRSRKLQ